MERTIPSGKAVIRIDKDLYNYGINIFYKNFLNHHSGLPTLNNDILALLNDGIKPTHYFDYEYAFDGVAEALTTKGITLDSLLGRKNTAELLTAKGIPMDSLPVHESTFADSAETSESEISEEAEISSNLLKDKTRRRHRPCVIS